MIIIQKELIKDNILYPVNLLSKNQQQSPNCYKRLFEDFYNKTNIKINKAIWCYSQLFKDEEICLNDKHINRAFEMGTINNPYAYLLNVPNNFCLQTSFYIEKSSQSIFDKRFCTRQKDLKHKLGGLSF